MTLYTWEDDVTVHMLGSDVTPPNAHVVVEVHPDRLWTGTLELWEGTSTPRDSWVFTTESGESFAFRIARTDGRTLAIEQFNRKHFRPPGRSRVRVADGSLAIGVHGHDVDRALAEVEVFNDDTWSAVLRLEGTGVYVVGGNQVRLGVGDRFDLRADRDGAISVVARLEQIDFSASGNDVAITFAVSGWEDSPPPL